MSQASAADPRPSATRAAKEAAVRREIAFRRKVYPGLVRNGRMTRAEAEAQIAIMEAILEDYRDPESEKQPPLF